MQTKQKRNQRRKKKNVSTKDNNKKTRKVFWKKNNSNEVVKKITEVTPKWPERKMFKNLNQKHSTNNEKEQKKMETK
jgi:hypothetical protein